MSCRWCPLDDLQSLWRNGWVLSKKSCKNLFPQPPLLQKKRLTTWSLKTLHKKRRSQVRSSHVARVAHAPPVRTRPFFFFFFFWLTRFFITHATNTKTQMKKNEPSGLLFTSSLLAKSGLDVTPLCREATRCEHRYRALGPSRSTSETLQGSGARSAPRGRVTECGAPVRRWITIMCCACIEKMAPSRWTFRSNKNLKKEQEGGKRSSLLFSTNFRRESWLIRWKVCACRSLLRPVCAVGRVL